MGKFLFGCTLFFFATLIVGGFFFYKGCYQPIKDNYADMLQMTKLGTFNDKLTKVEPYATPADGKLTEEQVHRFLAVQRDVRAAAGMSFTRVRERFESLPGRMKNPDGSYKLDFKELMSTFKGIGPDIVAVKEAQVAALNKHGFSLQEYRWVRESILRAMGEKVSGYIEDVARGPFGEPPATSTPPGTPPGHTPPATVPPRVESTSPTVPLENVALVRGVADSLKLWLPIAALGF